ncbi:hypothetical protein [Bythopirellula goksoeyrii]|uniref:Fimbrial assembly protein (PilN) n=1 Tax=Bythopirellula goksoeyrii TaxID=1400387 RepID=A0A5B9Q995_9BACT|nr:hypothetical protein [Bythopirellula goksoeyrii]QEG34200.1 hypothetical protein Pr1d_14730 [Bythopirellula goksoeyrii]
MSFAINLMTPYARRREIYRTRVRQWLSISSITLLILIITTSVHYYYVREINLERQLLETSLEPINHLKNANTRIVKQIAAIRDEEQFILALSSEKPTVTLLGLLGTAVAKAGDHVFVERLELSNLERSTTTPMETPIAIDIAGLANNKSSAGQLAEGFQTSIPSGKVEVTSNKETRLKNQLVHDFTLQGTFRNTQGLNREK